MENIEDGCHNPYHKINLLNHFWHHIEDKKNTNPANKQHKISKFWLRNLVSDNNPSEQAGVIDITMRKKNFEILNTVSNSRNIDSISAERNIFDMSIKDTYKLENMFAMLEASIAPVISKIINNITQNNTVKFDDSNFYSNLKPGIEDAILTIKNPTELRILLIMMLSSLYIRSPYFLNYAQKNMRINETVGDYIYSNYMSFTKEIAQRRIIFVKLPYPLVFSSSIVVPWKVDVIEKDKIFIIPFAKNIVLYLDYHKTHYAFNDLFVDMSDIPAANISLADHTIRSMAKLAPQKPNKKGTIQLEIFTSPQNPTISSFLKSVPIVGTNNLGPQIDLLKASENSKLDNIFDLFKQGKRDSDTLVCSCF